jgi:uncharacterized protein
MGPYSTEQINHGTRPVACVTGASSGIGAVFARVLAKDGYDLVLIARRLIRLQALADELLHTYDTAVECWGADLSEPATIEAVAETVALIPRLALLINNAGSGVPGLFAGSDIHAHQAQMQVHIMASIQLTHAALPGMLAGGQGAVINVASVSAFLPSPGSSTYAGAKAFLVNFSEALAMEYAQRGIRVQALCPGFTHTEFHDRLGIDTSTLRGMPWMSAEAVVAASLKGLKKNRVVVIPGLVNWMIAIIVRITPRRIFYFFNRKVLSSWKDDAKIL